MAYVPGYEWDIFVSYASDDNRGQAVEKCVAIVEREISDNLVNFFSPKEKVRIYFDRRRLAPNKVAKARASRPRVEPVSGALSTVAAASWKVAKMGPPLVETSVPMGSGANAPSGKVLNEKSWPKRSLTMNTVFGLVVEKDSWFAYTGARGGGGGPFSGSIQLTALP